MSAFSVHANAVNATGTLGVCNIKNPTYNSANTDSDPRPSEYNRVYFGWVPQTTTGMARNNNGQGNSTVYVDPYANTNDTLDMHNTPIYWLILNQLIPERNRNTKKHYLC